MMCPHRQFLILNVDDNTVGRYAKTRTLENAGFNVMEAGTGEEALAIVSGRHPQLVLLDLQLPDMNGFEVCRRIKNNPATSRTAVLHITATYTTEADEAISVQSGADIFLVEPVEPHELITVVRTLLRLRTTEMGLAESEERMRLATEGAGFATFDLDLRTDIAHWDAKLYALLGYPPATTPARGEMWRAGIHPEDLPRVLAALDSARRDGSLFAEEHRVTRHDDGAERWLAPYGKVHLDERGERTRFLGIVVDVTERKQAESEREQLLQQQLAARREAENAARLKDEFLATLSHELRNPMNAILGWLHLLRSGRLEHEQEQKALETIERNAFAQNELINDLLDVSRIVSGKLVLDPQPILLDEVIDAAVTAVRLAATGKRIELVVDAEGVLPMYADPGRLQQVFTNLLTNAVKFTPLGGTISVKATPAGDYYRVAVRDTGEGIAPDMLPHLFERFRQADGSTTRRHGGLGLGLAIVRQLVELHGGTVNAESAGPDRGATFTVMLPVHGEISHAHRPVPYGPRAAPHAAAAGRLRLNGLRVLVVDDEPAALGLMQHMLQSEGAIVRTATNAADALRSFSEARPGVLLLDIGMPREDGYSLIGKLRQHADGSVPAIAVTGYARTEDRERALGAGFQAHLPKPVDPNALVELIRSVTSHAS